MSIEHLKQKVLKPKLSLSQAPEKCPAESQSSGPASQAPTKGPGLLISLPGDGALALVTTITRAHETESNICHELKRDSVHQAPGNSVDSERSRIVPQSRYHVNSPSRKSFSSKELSDNSHSSSVTPRDSGFSHQRSLPRQYARPRSDRSPSKWRRHWFMLVSSKLSNSSRGRPRQVRPRNSSSRHKPRSLIARHRHSRSGSPRHIFYRSRSPITRSVSPRSKSPRSRSSRLFRYRHADLWREPLPRPRSVSKPWNDPVVFTLLKLFEQQGQLLKELSGRLDNFSSTSGMADKVTANRSGTKKLIHTNSPQEEDSNTEQFKVLSIGDTELDNEEREETPKESSPTRMLFSNFAPGLVP